MSPATRARAGAPGDPWCLPEGPHSQFAFAPEVPHLKGAIHPRTES